MLSVIRTWGRGPREKQEAESSKLKAESGNLIPAFARPKLMITADN
jgi:hypothetical protein